MSQSAGSWATPTVIVLGSGFAALLVFALWPRHVSASPLPPLPNPTPGIIPDVMQPAAQRPDRQPVPMPVLNSEEKFRQAIRIMQTQLKAIGYRIPVIDGIVTPGGPTEVAIRAFARAKHLPLTQGIESARTIASAVDDEYGARFPNGAPT
jgi:hypothetical protein